IELAARLGAPLRLIHCEAPEPVLRVRIAERSRTRRDASEATSTVLEWQLSHVEPVTAEEEIEVVRVDSVRPDALEQALREMGPCGASGGGPTDERRPGPRTPTPPNISSPAGFPRASPAAGRR
ncbi:MAG: AAA family ATPase, partial [Steroidobacteraceae bacterium]